MFERVEEIDEAMLLRLGERVEYAPSTEALAREVYNRLVAHGANPEDVVLVAMTGFRAGYEACQDQA